MSHSRALALAAGASLAGGLIATALAVPAAGAAAPTAGAHIVAHPDSVMVDTATRLTGTHFPAKTKITIKECTERNWIVPQNPCDASPVRVRTNAKGTFQIEFTVHTCPGDSRTPGFSQTCYVGEPTISGLDTQTLTAAATITVTGP